MCSAICFRTRTRSFFCSGTCRTLCAFFFARRRATRSESAAFVALRSSLGRWANCAPRSGLPLGIVVGTGFVVGWALRKGDDVEVRGSRETLDELGSVLQRSTRSLRLANLSFPGSRASISSTHSRSCLGLENISLVQYRSKTTVSPQIGHMRSPCRAACPCREQFARGSPTSLVSLSRLPRPSRNRQQQRYGDRALR